MLILETIAGTVLAFIGLIWLGAAYERGARAARRAAATVGLQMQRAGEYMHHRATAHTRWQAALLSTRGAMLAPGGETPCCGVSTDECELVERDPHTTARLRDALFVRGAAVGESRWVAACTCGRHYLVLGHSILALRRLGGIAS